MSFKAKIIEDSEGPSGFPGSRLTTMEITYPRFIHSEFMTHRVFSRNSASSRAIPVKKMLEKVREEPVIPIEFGTMKSGMQAGPPLEGEALEEAIQSWLDARDVAVSSAEALLEQGIHKQIVNRVLEPFSWITVIVTGSYWKNFFALRCHPDAQPEIHHLADMMKAVYEASVPKQLSHGDWHLPYVNDEERATLPIENLLKLATARCARVSYLTHDGVRDLDKDYELFDRLVQGSGSGHWSPLEHPAQASKDLRVAELRGNFGPYWKQYRKTFSQENRENTL
jgi:thymidylate synthase ThyX